MLLGRHAEEDRLVTLLGFVLIGHQILGPNGLLLLLVLLHVRNERIGRPFDLCRVQLVWGLILLLRGERCLGLLLDLLGDLLRLGHCCGVSIWKSSLFQNGGRTRPSRDSTFSSAFGET